MSVHRAAFFTLAIVGGMSLFVFSFAAENQSRQDKQKAVDATKETEVKKLMRKKLDHAQKLLEGIALSEFDKIDKFAAELMEVSKTAEWKVLKTRDYELYSNDFRRSLQEMVKNAKAKNLDAATRNYTDMTLTCVKCHKHVRETRITFAIPENEREITVLR